MFFMCVQMLSNAVRWISDSAGEAVVQRGSRMVLTGERGNDDVPIVSLVLVSK